jgi:hypothetical protein
MKKIIFFILAASILCPFNSNAARLEFFDSFENGLHNWAKHGDKIEIVKFQGIDTNLFAKIVIDDPWGYTFISRSFNVPSKGQLRIEGKVWSSNVVPGVRPYFRGKFIAVVLDRGKEIAYYDADFEGTSGQWVPKIIIIPDLDPRFVVDLRLGIQNATGIAYFDDIHVCFIPSDECCIQP